MSEDLFEDGTEIRTVNAKRKYHDEIDQQIAEFLERGGKINVIPSGLHAFGEKAVKFNPRFTSGETET